MGNLWGTVGEPSATVSCVGWSFGGYVLDPDRFELRNGAEVVALEPRALQILQMLVERHGELVRKEEVLDEVWGDRFVGESALTTQIKELRRALGDTGRDQQVIRTVHGRGYSFVAPLDPSVPEQPTAADSAQPANGASDTNAVLTNPVVAVLPFVDLSAGEERRHIAEGLSHDVVAALSRHRWLRVLTRAATAGLATEPNAIGRLRHEFDVRYVVEGTVRLDDRRMRVTATLTDAESGACLWTERFDREFDDLYDVLDEIVDVAAAIVEPEVGHAERSRIVVGSRADLQAWELFHLGLAHFYRFTADDNLEAQRLLAQCRELDPAFADAHAWWAYSVVLGMVYWSTEPDDGVLDEALAATEIALGIDDHNAAFHMLRGRVQLARREYDNALSENQRAIELNPSFAAAFCGLGDSLCYEGRYDEAIEYFRRSLDLGSHDPQRWAFLSYGALAFIFDGQFEHADEWAERALAIPNCQYWAAAHALVAQAHLAPSGDLSYATARLVEMCPEFTIAYAREKLFFLKRPEQLARYLDGLRRADIPES